MLVLKECMHDQNDCSLRCLIQTSSDIYPINPVRQREKPAPVPIVVQLRVRPFHNPHMLTFCVVHSLMSSVNTIRQQRWGKKGRGREDCRNRLTIFLILITKKIFLSDFW